jgi:hypothetical protein
MAAINDLNLILHNIRVKLYPNYLPGAKGKYLARTDSDKTVNVKDICTIMVTRAGFDGSIDTLYDYVVQFFDEMCCPPSADSTFMVWSFVPLRTSH